MSRPRAALGAFLRARRERMTPQQAGMVAFPGPRRVPGLRREELAVLAGVSADYYSRLEQGRQGVVSPGVLDALARALRLDEVERAHLHDLAAPPRPPVHAQPAQRPHPGLVRLMETLDHVPALLLGRRGEVLAGNDLLAAVLGRALRRGEAFPRFLFLDPLARERITNWADFAADAVAALRLEAGRHPHDVALRALIDELRAADPYVARWWNEHQVRDADSVVKRIRHPAVGELAFTIETVALPQEPDQRLVVYTTPPGSPTARLLPLLASWEAPVEAR